MRPILMFICVMTATLFGCEVPRVAAPHHVKGTMFTTDTPDCVQNSDPEICKLGKENVAEMKWYAENEWQYNRNGPSSTTQRPQVCVSFSGGGIRSAAFAIGVMQGLHEKPVLNAPPQETLFKHVDVLSGTSGGAYALSWYYSQPPTSGQADAYDKEAFDPNGYAQGYLREHAHFLGIPAYLASFGIDLVPMSAVNFVLNGIWGTHLNTSLGHHIYESNIRDTFHRGQTRTLVDLSKEIIPKYHLPYFIITTTSRIDENYFHSDAKLRNTVFEFTALRIGHDGFTYVRPEAHPEFADLDDIVATSGAAPDSSQRVSGSAKRFLLTVFNQDYGQYIRNYNDTRHPLRRFLTKLLPLPAYFVTESYTRDRFGAEIYLSDGGHQENLAAYPLVRRQCENLIIVDGEYDQEYEFEGYFKLKHSLEAEMHVAVTLDPTTFCKESTRPDCRETNIDLIEERLRRNSETPGTRGEDDERRKGITRCCFTGQHPIVSGSIRSFPMYDTANRRFWRQDIQLTYIKLSIDNDLFKDWREVPDEQRAPTRRLVGRYAANYYADSIQNRCSVRYFYPCDFPQFSTAYQSFTAEQFQAYTDLGASLVKQHLKAERLPNGHLALTTVDPFAPQPRPNP